VIFVEAKGIKGLGPRGLGIPQAREILNFGLEKGLLTPPHSRDAPTRAKDAKGARPGGGGGRTIGVREVGLILLGS
jgi:hypothetical protein